MHDSEQPGKSNVVSPEEFLAKRGRPRGNKEQEGSKPARGGRRLRGEGLDFNPKVPPSYYPLIEEAVSLGEKGSLTEGDLIRLAELMGYQVGFNVMLHRPERFYGEDEVRAVEAVDFLRVINDFRVLGDFCYEYDKGVAYVLRSRRVVEDAFSLAINRNSYHPLIRYWTKCMAESYRPGSIDRLAGFFQDKNGAAGLFLKKWLVGCVARQREGFQNYTLVLQGGQGIGKSTFAKWLTTGIGGDYFQEGPIIPDNKDHLLRLANKWIWAVDEFGETSSRREQNLLKAFLTYDTINERPPYGRCTVTMKRACNIIATTNNMEFLSDTTGSRRYLSLHLEGIDHAYSGVIGPDEVWAEALMLYLDGYPFRLSAEEKRVQERINAESESDDSLTNFLFERFRPQPGHNMMAMDVHAVVFDKFGATTLRDQNALMKQTVAVLKDKMGISCRRVSRGRQFVGLSFAGR